MCCLPGCAQLTAIGQGERRIDGPRALLLGALERCGRQEERAMFYRAVVNDF